MISGIIRYQYNKDMKEVQVFRAIICIKDKVDTKISEYQGYNVYKYQGHQGYLSDLFIYISVT